MGRKKINLFEKSFEEIRHSFRTSNKRELQYHLDHYQDREWKSEEDKLQKTPVLHLDDPNHRLPTTRRDFLAAGITKTFATTILTPACLNAFSSSKAHAQSAVNCDQAAGGAGGLAPHVPFFTIDADGGFSVAGDNFIVGQNNNPYDFFADYSQFALPANQHPSVVAPATPFGAGTMPFHPQSQLLQGILNRASATTLANTDGFLIAVESGDDSSGNLVNLTHAAYNAGIRGTMAEVVGTEGSGSGGRVFGANQRGEIRARSIRPVILTTEAAASQLTSSGTLETVLQGNTNQIQSIVRSISALNEAQSLKVNTQAMPLGAVTNIVCGGKLNEKLIGDTGVTIYNDPTVQQVFGANLGQNAADESDGDSATATTALMAIQGKCGPVSINVSQCDYHGNGRPRQDARDLRIGEIIGSILELAALNNSPVFINLVTDGSTSASDEIGQNSVLFEAGSDNGLFGANVVIAYNPAAKPEIMQRQFGNYSQNGVVPNSTAWASNPEVGARLVFANYLHVNNKLNEFAKIFPTPGFNVNDVIAIGNKFK